MQGCWLNHKGTPGCILFMAGWGMGPEPFAGLFADDRDCFFCADYRDLSLPDLGWIKDYATVDLLAWSMGVWVAAATLAPYRDRFVTRTALAGTLHPIDDRRGIPVAAWMEMEDHLDAAMMERFYASMFEDDQERQRFLAHRPTRSPASLREELTALRRHVNATGPVQDIFTRRIVTRRDRIFPPRNQLRAWGKDNCEIHPWPHFSLNSHCHQGNYCP